MTEEQGDEIIDLLRAISRRLDNIEGRIPVDNAFTKNLDDIYRKIEDVETAVHEMS